MFENGISLAFYCMRVVGCLLCLIFGLLNFRGILIINDFNLMRYKIETQPQEGMLCIFHFVIYLILNFDMKACKEETKIGG